MAHGSFAPTVGGNVNFTPPSGLDRADGLGGFPGTATPPTAIIKESANGASIFEELKTSPDMEQAEQATVVHNFNCDQDNALTIWAGQPRGTVTSDSFGNDYLVLSSRYTQQPGNQALLTITGEGTSFGLPPQEFGVEVVEFNPDLCRHPLFLPVTQYNGFASDGVTPVFGTQIVSLCKAAGQQPQYQVQQDSNGALNSSLITDPTVLQLALLLADKYAQGEETFYLAGFKVTWSVYSRLPLELNPGSYIQDPVGSGVLPFFFWSANGTPFGANIFTALAAALAPQYYANGFSSLRLSDSIVFQRTWFKTTAQWIMAPFGHWDTDIYTG